MCTRRVTVRSHSAESSCSSSMSSLVFPRRCDATKYTPDTAFIRQVRAHDRLNTLITTYRCLTYMSLEISGRQKNINGQSLTSKSSGETTSLTTASMFPETGCCPRPLCHVPWTFATTLSEWTAWRQRSTHKAKASRRFYVLPIHCLSLFFPIKR